MRRWSSPGYAESGSSSPYPAVRLVPMNRIVRREPSVASARGAGADATAVVSAPGRAVDRSPRPHPATASAATTHHDIDLMLVARSLSKSYRSGDRALAVLRDVSFAIPARAFVAI